MPRVERPRRSTGVRVCHVSTAHSADDSRVFWRECVGLASAGFSVTLVARADSDRTSHGVHVVALPTYRRRLVRMTLGVTRAFVEAVRSRSKIVHLHDPELIPLVVPLRLMRKRVVYDAHEWLSRQVAAKEYLPPLARRGAGLAARALESAVGHLANRVVTVNEACAAAYPADKVAVVANFPERTLFDGATGLGGAADGFGTFAYVGGISVVRGVEALVSAIEQVNLTDTARLDLLGPFRPPALLEKLSRQPGWAYVDYAGAVPHDRVAEHLGNAVAGLATLLATPNHLISSPVKVFEYMAMGLPVIISDFPQWRRMLDGVDCAIWVDPADPAAVADAMRTLLRDPDRRRELGENGRRAVAERFNWDTQLKTLVGVYTAVLR